MAERKHLGRTDVDTLDRSLGGTCSFFLSRVHGDCCCPQDALRRLLVGFFGHRVIAWVAGTIKEVE